MNQPCHINPSPILRNELASRQVFLQQLHVAKLLPAASADERVTQHALVAVGAVVGVHTAVLVPVVLQPALGTERLAALTAGVGGWGQHGWGVGLKWYKMEVRIQIM